VAVSADGKSVYVVSFASDAVARLNRNTTTGAITQPAGAAGCVSETGVEPCADGRGLDGAFSVAVSADGKSVTVVREVDGGIATLQCQLPAVVTTDLRLNQPRYASLPGIMKAKNKPIEELTPAALGVDVAPKLTVVKMSAPPPRKAGIKVKDVAELVEKLKNEAKVL
jgi:hypothetical protein